MPSAASFVLKAPGYPEAAVLQPKYTLLFQAAHALTIQSLRAASSDSS